MASIRKRGTGWEAQVRIRGFKPLTHSFKTKADAVQWANEREAEVRRGTYVDTRSLRSETLHTLLERYLREVAPKHLLPYAPSQPRRAVAVRKHMRPNAIGQ